MFLEEASQPIRWKERIGTLAVGHTAKTIEVILLDYGLYGPVAFFLTIKLGWLWGSIACFAIMAPMSALECYGLIKLYDWAGKDFFAFEKVKEFRDGDPAKVGRRMRLVQRLMKLGDVPAFFAILLLHPLGDPFMATVYLRKGAGKYNGMTKRDWWIFFTAVIVSNADWTLKWSTAVTVIMKFIWPATRHWFA